MKLSKENKDAFLMQIHQIVYDTKLFVLNNMKDTKDNSLEYYVLTDEEEVYINKIKKSPILQSVIEKILTRSLDDSFFNLLSIIDGASEPLEEFGKKSDFLLLDMPDNFDESYEFLHDDFFESYDMWEKINSDSSR